MQKKKETIVPYVICAIILLWFIASTVEVWLYHADVVEYHKANVWIILSAKHTDMIVRDCKGISSDDYEITVEDIEGNLYAYIDGKPREIGEVIRITMSGTDIINAK